MERGYDVFVQAIGFVGLFIFFVSYQVKTNKLLFALQTLGCLTFSFQFALLGAYSGCLSILLNLIRNVMLMKYNDYRLIRWRGWAAIFPYWHYPSQYLHGMV